MAGYSYRSGGYVAQEKNRSGTTIQPWRSSCDGVEEQSDQWRSTGLVNNCEGCQDQRFNPEDNTRCIVTKRQTVVQHINGPLVTRYKDNAPTRTVPTKDYGTINNERTSPANLSYERPPVVDEFIGKVQTEASRPARMGPLNGVFWRHTPKPPPSHVGANGYRDSKDRDRYETAPNVTQEPTVITTGGWTRPSRAVWATPANYDSPLGKPTNEIETAVNYLKEAINTSSDKTFTTDRLTKPSPSVPRVDFSPPKPAIDSKEAAWRYNGMILKPGT